MLMKKVDTMGRRVPKFDRQAAGRKAALTRKEREGENIHSRIGAIGGRHRKRGYFGTLKDQGKDRELKIIQRRGGQASKRKSAKKN